MRQAKQRGTTLEVVANCIRGSLQSARNAYAYIHRVLSEDRDWNQYAERVEARALAQAEKAAAEQIRVERRRKIQTIDGQAFRHADTGRIYEVYDDAALVFESIEQWRKGLSIGGCSAIRVIELLESGLVAKCA
jgi:crotonobetainyl-CoA:carnitine CoA-transferase CaiB-like acyl-CoA transferase